MTPIARARSCSSLLRAPLPKADIQTLRVFVEWRRQRLAIRALARRAGYFEGTVARFLAGGPVRNREAIARDLGQALGLIPLKDNEGGYPRGTGYA